MIKGTGVDIVHITRIRNLIDEHGERFLKKILSDVEISKMPEATKDHYTAGRFAAKEALVKASGNTFNFNELSVINDSSGSPSFTGERLPEILNDGRVCLSISHDSDYAVAFVIIEK